MKVELISHTPNPEELVAQSAKLCYSAVGVSEIKKKLTDEEIDRFVNHLISISHESPLEHITFTFAVEGVSRSLTHQLIRHRIGASYSQQSQRYVRLDNFEYVTPEEIRKDSKLCNIYQRHLKETQEVYDYLVEGLMKNGRSEKEAIEDARYIFPNACETKIVFTMNARSLINFFKQRCCTRAQWEIRDMANEMLIQVRKVAPIVFNSAGASCVNEQCPEGKMSCGKPQTRLESK